MILQSTTTAADSFKAKSPRNKRHQNQNLRTTHHLKIPTSWEIPTTSLWGMQKKGNRIRSINQPVVAVSECVRSETRCLLALLATRFGENRKPSSQPQCYPPLCLAATKFTAEILNYDLPNGKERKGRKGFKLDSLGRMVTAIVHKPKLESVVAMASAEESKLETFRQWLQANGVELRGCKIKWCDSKRGFGIFSDKDVSDGVMMVVPLDLAITPMRVLQDPLLGPACRAMFEEGEVDDRLLMMLLLTVERLRKNSLWKPYLDMLPTTFGNPLWFSDDELQELRGTTLYRATELQKKSLISLYESKVKDIAQKLLTLDGNSEIEVRFEDFLWANSVFWSRALNIPMPRSYVFPEMQDAHDSCVLEADKKRSQNKNSDNLTKEGTYNTMTGDSVWVEGLVPGIDFCNHDLKPIATWEVDGTGLTTGIPLSMYLVSAAQSPLQIDQEIFISYGNKGNEELLYLYGFVIDDNTDDYLMVHYPAEAINTISFSESKSQLLEVQKAEMRCLLPKTLLDNGFFPPGTQNSGENKEGKVDQVCNYSWSGQRKTPSYVNKLVFPEKFMTTLRTIAMQEDELFKVSSMLEELVGPERERQLSDTDIQSAVWEVCGDSGALQLLVDLLRVKMMDLEESSGTEENDLDLLKKALVIESQEDIKQSVSNLSTKDNESEHHKLMNRNKWSAIVYRRGQKQLTSLFLKEAEHALQLSLNEEEMTSRC
ncbi:hypothetical protein VNO78_15365 [Psophocarpus tetragonolobus]|uniref:SET domain-containing protein n=1 Tax=Psophocarpus tetragonolobus TaxID=3891 RepID=A0AAN9SGC9_PSOTE